MTYYQVVCQNCGGNFMVNAGNRSRARYCEACRKPMKYAAVTELCKQKRKAENPREKIKARPNFRTIDRLAIYQYVQSNPGVKPWRISQALGHTRGSVYNALPSLEDMGLYLTEDNNGRLYTMDWSDDDRP